MQPIHVLLKPLIRAHQLESGLLTLRLQTRWSELVGAQIAGHSLPMDIRGETLMVTVDSPVWSQELSLLRDQLLQRVNALGERPVLRQIRFRVGEIPEICKQKIHPPPFEESKPYKASLETSWIAGLIEPVSDPGLKAQLQKTLFRVVTRGNIQ